MLKAVAALAGDADAKVEADPKLVANVKKLISEFQTARDEMGECIAATIREFGIVPENVILDCVKQASGLNIGKDIVEKLVSRGLLKRSDDAVAKLIDCGPLLQWNGPDDWKPSIDLPPMPKPNIVYNA